jgi:hypothetical protein
MVLAVVALFALVVVVEILVYLYGVDSRLDTDRRSLTSRS